jgi:hypothetical protein
MQCQVLAAELAVLAFWFLSSDDAFCVMVYMLT